MILLALSINTLNAKVQLRLPCMIDKQDLPYHEFVQRLADLASKGAEGRHQNFFGFGPFWLRWVIFQANEIALTDRRCVCLIPFICPSFLLDTRSYCTLLTLLQPAQVPRSLGHSYEPRRVLTFCDLHNRGRL